MSTASSCIIFKSIHVHTYKSFYKAKKRIKTLENLKFKAYKIKIADLNIVKFTRLLKNSEVDILVILEQYRLKRVGNLKLYLCFLSKYQIVRFLKIIMKMLVFFNKFINVKNITKIII